MNLNHHPTRVHRRAAHRGTCMKFCAVVGLALSGMFCGAQQASAGGRLASAIEPYVDRHELAGAVMLVASKDKILDLETVGYSDVKAKKPLAPDELFWIASQTKPMTVTALMMLVDEGKVNVEDPVEKYLPEFKNQMLAVERDAEHVLLRKPAHAMKVREILSHTSGLPFKSPVEEPTLDLMPLRDAVRSYTLVPLEYEPGTRYQYSNAGINTAGRIIEVVSGMPYERFLQERLFRPLGMKDTTFWPTSSQLKRLAKSYKPDASKLGLEETSVTQLKYPLNDPTRQPMPAGGLFSTARDVARFCQMVLNGGEFEGKRYLSPEAVRQMTRKQTGENVKEGYGFGWSTDGKIFGHGGAYATNMEIDSERGLILVWMVQHAGFPGKGSEAFGTFKHAAPDTFALKP